MNNKDRREAAPAVAGASAGGSAPPIKERIFSIIKRLGDEGITDGRRWLWIDFTPHIVVEKREDGYRVLLWREGVVVKIILDNEFKDRKSTRLNSSHAD